MEYFNEYKGKSVLITGGAGCIGSNLTKGLLKAGVSKVVILDDLSASQRWNIPTDPRVYLVVGSVADDGALQESFREAIDYVFHLAAHFANQNSVDYPDEDLETNGLGTLKVLQQSLKKGIKRFVYASSGCSVYGSQAPLPLKEDYMSLYLDTPYQIHKLLGELYCNYFYNYYGLPVAIARYFNVYGGGEIPGAYRNVIPNFTWGALHGQPLIITGTGKETRDFTFVDDIVDGTMRLGVMVEAIGDAFNLASGVETDILSVAHMVNAITENEEGIRFADKRDWDKITRRRASIEKAKSILGYNPQTKIQDGIRVVYDWIVANQVNIERDARF